MLATSPWICNGIEHVQLNALGGADTITVNDLTGTGRQPVAIDLARHAGSGSGDGQVDTVVINGTAGDDMINSPTTTAWSRCLVSPRPVTITGFDAN